MFQVHQACQGTRVSWYVRNQSQDWVPFITCQLQGLTGASGPVGKNGEMVNYAYHLGLLHSYMFFFRDFLVLEGFLVQLEFRARR